MADHYEETRMVTPRRSRQTGILLLLAVAGIALASFMVWLSPGGNKGQELGTGRTGTPDGSRGEVGTFGPHGPKAEGTDNNGPAAGPGVSVALAELKSFDQIQKLVGRRVDVDVPVGRYINDVAFWVGDPDNRLLVVVSRDTRDSRMRVMGEPAQKGITVPNGVEMATLSGTIERLPAAETMFSWGLTNPDRHELLERPIYLRVDSIQPGGSAAAAS